MTRIEPGPPKLCHQYRCQILMHGANVNGDFESSAVLRPEPFLIPLPSLAPHYGSRPSRVVRRHAVLFYQRRDFVEVLSQCRELGKGKKIRLSSSLPANCYQFLAIDGVINSVADLRIAEGVL